MSEREHVLRSLKTGDRVWVGDSENPCKHVKTVVRTTATLILLGESEFDRYSKEDGCQISPLHNRDYISALATPAERTAYDQKEAVEEERDRIEAERVRLNGLLPKTAHVSDFTGSTWSLTFENLSTTHDSRPMHQPHGCQILATFLQELGNLLNSSGRVLSYRRGTRPLTYGGVPRTTVGANSRLQEQANSTVIRLPLIDRRT
jgi:hypothetical protein